MYCVLGLQHVRIFQLLVTILYLQHRVAQEDILRHNKMEEVSEVVYEVASQAYTHLQKVC